MFRQTIILVSLFAGGFAWWIEVGTRVSGDQHLYTQTNQTIETVLPTIHILNTFFLGGKNTFTFSRLEVYEVRFL